MRRCESCHSAESHNSWLPYVDRHMAVLSCESCHVPHLYAPAIESVDWTVLNAEGASVVSCRGTEDANGGVDTLIEGFTPVLLLRDNIDGGQQLAPYNLISAWYWIYAVSYTHLDVYKRQPCRSHALVNSRQIRSQYAR